MILNRPLAIIEPHKMENKHIKENKGPMGMAKSPRNMLISRIETEPQNQRRKIEKKEEEKELIFYHETHKQFLFIDKTTLAFS